MVIEIAKWIVLVTIGINVLCVNGQPHINEEIVECVELTDVTHNNEEIEDILKNKIQVKLNESEDMKWMTSQNKVLEVQWKEGNVTVNLHEDIIGYGGGTYTEYILGALIMEAVFENSEAEVVTILVDGEPDCFPEGSDYTDCTREDYETYYRLDKQTPRK